MSPLPMMPFVSVGSPALPLPQHGHGPIIHKNTQNVSVGLLLKGFLASGCYLKETLRSSEQSMNKELLR